MSDNSPVGRQDDSDDSDDQSVVCPLCSGDGTVDCYCGGDLCVCENNGERDCPLCLAVGVVSTDVEAKYFADRRAAWEAFYKAKEGENE